MEQNTARWQFWIDRGGTFTDVVGRAPDGEILCTKLLSDNPEHYPDAAVEGIRRMLGLQPGEPVPGERVEAVKMGTTVSTNALLERKGERVALVINRGFGDVLRIGTQQRPRLFDLQIVLPEQLYEIVVEVAGRISAQGEEIEPLDLGSARESLLDVLGRGIRAVAIVWLHGYRYPQQEQQIAELARQVGFTQVSTSHSTSQLIKLVNRGDTTVADAYLSPVLHRYVDQVRGALPGVRLLFMQSNGGLADATVFQGKNSILSGPAGGVVGAAAIGVRAGFERIIGFDMGGTSTDVMHFAGEFERRFETEVGGVRICAPMMHIHSVAAGGGSICRFDGTRLRVGPESAGANPGPACYRRGGPLTVTDCNVMLGRLCPDFFPKIFGPRGDLPIDRELVIKRFGELATETGGLSAEEVASGFLRIAVDNMANAIKKISTARGHDVSGYTLVTFGGAGGQHACAVADALGMDRILIHPLAGVLSAYGIGLAKLRALRESSVEKPLDKEGLIQAGQLLDRLEREARQQLHAQQSVAETIVRKFHVRYRGTNTPLAVDAGSIIEMREAFQTAHQVRFGFVMDPDERCLMIDSVSVEAISGTENQTERLPKSQHTAEPWLVAEVNAMFAGTWRATPVFERERMASGTNIEGPAIIIERTATTVVEPGWKAEITPRLDLLLSRARPRPARLLAGVEVDPILLEIFNNLFMSVAEQMGAVLQNSAYSVNIKE